ncbi:MAG: hypothetical protein E7256_15850 [Lachnospiraceae bacterium]|nr:hypothetical protein [Lachnospiraceae bacterium]
MSPNRLILFEGLPGTGKSTLSKQAYEILTNHGIPAVLYNEGNLHPADLSWSACVPLSKLPNLFQTYPAYESAIKEHMSLEADYAVIAYTEFPIKEEDQALYDLLASYEIYDARIPLADFKKKHYDRWERFAKEHTPQFADDIPSNGITSPKEPNSEQRFIFECTLLQNHINELLLFHNQNEEEIILHISHLVELVKDLNPVLIYLNPTDIAHTTKNAAKERCNPSGEPVWLNSVCKWIEESPYGKAHSLSGLPALLAYLKNRKHIEEIVMHALPIPCYILYNDTHDWMQMNDKIRKILLNADVSDEVRHKPRIK